MKGFVILMGLISVSCLLMGFLAVIIEDPPSLPASIASLHWRDAGVTILALSTMFFYLKRKRII